MGIAIAQEILARGGKVHLVLGPTTETPPNGAKCTLVETSNDMLEEVMRILSKEKIDGFISTAAVLDFIPERTEDTKIRSGQKISIDFVPSAKIINKARESYKDLFIVCFKVESNVSDGELESRAREKVHEKICDLVVANDEKREGVAFGSNTNEVIVVGKEGFRKKIPLAPKREVARSIMDVIVDCMKT
jgi:phosphopantothenoylcysteine decarboxylase/phosphopantothenate--cysteine ligase